MTGIHQGVAGSGVVLTTPKIAGFQTNFTVGADFWTCNTPSGNVAGNLLIVGVAIPSSGPINAVPFFTTSGTGLTSLLDSTIGALRQRIFYRTLTGVEVGNLTGDITGSVMDVSVWAIILSSATGTPEITAITGSASSSPDPASITPSWGLTSPSLFLTSLAKTGTATASAINAYPAGYTLQNTSIGDGTLTVSQGFAAYRKRSSPENPGPFTLSSAPTSYIAHTIAVQSA